MYSSDYSAFLIDIQRSKQFYEIRILAICISIKTFKSFLEYLEFYSVVFWRWFSPKSCLTNYVPRVSCLPVAYKKKFSPNECKVRRTLPEKCPYSESFWSAFLCICTEYGQILRISPYSVWMWEYRNIRTRKTPNTDIFYRRSWFYCHRILH